MLDSLGVYCNFYEYFFFILYQSYMYIKTFKKKSPTVIFENSYFVEKTPVSVEMVYLPWQQTLTMALSHVSVTLMDRWVLIVVGMEDNVNVDRMSLVVNVPDVRRDTMVSQDVQVCHYSHSGMGFDGFVWTPPLDNQELLKV